MAPKTPKKYLLKTRKLKISNPLKIFIDFSQKIIKVRSTFPEFAGLLKFELFLRRKN